MSDALSRRRFIQTAAAALAASSSAELIADGADGDSSRRKPIFKSNLVLNDDGHVFLYLNDDLTKDNPRRYIASYCRLSVRLKSSVSGPSCSAGTSAFKSLVRASA